MTRTNIQTLVSCSVLAATALALGCSPKAPSRSEPRHEALTTSNGFIQNGLSANGFIQNGFIQNGFIQNGFIQNGFIQNGFIQNGFIQNGFIQNGFIQNGLIGDALRTSPYARQLFQYIYSCAMPKTSTATLDPSNGAPPACLVDEDCEDGYGCSGGSCVVPLTGDLGLGINQDGTSWEEKGTCDGSCQRWISACLLARTNAYGKHVEISLRAPAYTPPGQKAQFDRIRAALAITDRTGTEFTEFNRREGAYFGNLFATTPVTFDEPSNAFVPAWITVKKTDFEGSGTSIGTYDPDHQFVPGYPSLANGPIKTFMTTPVLTACAGPASNIPEITNRFCSSQGDNVVINVPGVCLPNPDVQALGACLRDDSYSPDGVGSIEQCYTTTDPALQVPANRYDEVLTVFLQKPGSTFGNGICEAGEEDPLDKRFCKSDCPEGWSKNLDSSSYFGGGVIDVNSDSTVGFAAPEISVVAPDDSIIIVGRSAGDLDFDPKDTPRQLGDPEGFVAKFGPDGKLLWTRRFQPAAPPAPGSTVQWAVTGGAVVDRNGTITVVGTATDTFQVCPDVCSMMKATVLWFNSFDSNGTAKPPYLATIGSLHSASIGTYKDVTLTRAIAVDSQGKITLAGNQCGVLSFLKTNPPPPPGDPFVTLQNNNNCHPIETFGGGQSSLAALFAAKVAPPPPGGTSATFDWVQSLGDGGPLVVSGGGSSDSSSREAGFVGLSMVVDHHDDDVVLLTGGPGGRLQKLHSADGTSAWTKRANDPDEGGFKAYSVATVGGATSDDVYVSGYLAKGARFTCSSVPALSTDNVKGLPPFIERKSGIDGSCKWVKFANTECKQVFEGGQWKDGDCGGSWPPDSSSPRVEGASIGFDPSGNVILGSFGTPVVGGGIKFGSGGLDAKVGTIATYTAKGIFLSSYNSETGRLGWAKQIPTVLSSFLLGMDIDSQGNVVVNGNFSGSMVVNGDLLVTRLPEQPKVIDSFIGSFAVPSKNEFALQIGDMSAGAAGTPEPLSTVPKHLVAQATQPGGAEVFYKNPIASDDDGTGVSVECSPRANSVFPIDVTTTVTCTASDPLGNKSTASFTVTVADKLGPVFLPLHDVTTPATTPDGATVVYAGPNVPGAPAAIDQVDGPVTPTCAPASGSVFPVGPTPVTCTAKDTRNNTSTATFTVTVKPPHMPNTAPVVTVPANITVTAVFGSPSAVVTYAATATDAQDAGLVPVCAPASGSPFAIGTTTVSCTATDLGGLSDTKTFTVTVLPGTPPNTPPVITVPASITVEATSAAGAKVTFTAKATDAEDGTTFTPTCSPASGTTFAIGTKTVNCTATDSKGLSATKSFTVTVKDSKAPTFCDVPGTIKAFATSKAGAKVTYVMPHANDTVDSAPKVSCSLPSGSQFPVNKTTVTCTATDKAGNKATATFTVWVTYQAPTDGTFFLLPIRSNGSSVFKIGRPVPARFRLTGASAGITDLVAKLTVTKISNTVQGTVLDTSDETVDDTDFLFKYRPLLKFYAYRWKTRDQTQGTFQLKADLGDGVTHQINVSLKP